MAKKVKSIKIDGDSLTIEWDNGDFMCATINPERTADLLANSAEIVATDAEILAGLGG